MKKMVKQKNKGITLIALVITIIVLLILAGVTIAAVSGENGLLNKAEQAMEEHKKAAAEEQIKLKLNEWKIEKEQNPDSVLEDFLKNRFGEDNVSKNEDNTYTVIQDGYEGIVDEDGNLIGDIQKAGPRPQVENIQITTDGDNVVEDYSIEEGTSVQINFTATMKNGTITSIEPPVPYTTNGPEMEVEFKIIGEIDGEEYITKRTISVESKYSKLQKPNPPKIAEGMIPIKWNGSNWVVCRQDDPEWYNYVDQTTGIDGQSKWANVMLSDGTYKAGSVKEGTEIGINDLGSMYVWIPRYAYNINSLYHTANNNAGGDVQIAFLEGTKEYSGKTQISYSYQGEKGTDKLDNISGQGKWNEHPAFTFGEDILSGIWVAKFEAGNSNCTTSVSTGETNYSSKAIKIQPNKTSWRKMSIGDAFDACMEMSSKYSETYKISNDKDIIDPHMMKNIEWGAVAYFTQSSYGRNKHEISINSSNTFLTGGGNYTSNVNQSTTGNVTGIYDMNGGAWEYVAGYLNNESSNLTTYGSSLLKAESKYKDVYSKGNTDTGANNYTANSSKYGDAVYETSFGESGSTSWYGGYSNFPFSSDPFFNRGGYYRNGENAGLFSLYYNTIYVNEYNSLRPVLVVD